MKYRKLLILLITISTLGVLFIANYTFIKENKESNVFTQEEWNSQQNTRRYSMAQNLIKEKALDGKTKGEVKVLLGANGLVHDTEKSLFYIVGTNIIDPWVFVIEFDDAGIVKRYIIVDG